MTDFFSRDSAGNLAIRADTAVYSMVALQKACHRFTDRCHVFLKMADEEERFLEIVLSPKSQTETDLETLAGEFFNELLDEQLRRTVSQETRQVREMIVAQAFSEGNLLDQVASEADYEEDPLGILHGP